jgi:hypothetical protein
MKNLEEKIAELEAKLQSEIEWKVHDPRHSNDISEKFWARIELDMALRELKELEDKK